MDIDTYQLPDSCEMSIQQEIMNVCKEEPSGITEEEYILCVWSTYLDDNIKKWIEECQKPLEFEI